MKAPTPTRIRNIWLALTVCLLGIGLGLLGLQAHRYNNLIDESAKANHDQGTVIAHGLQYTINNVEEIATLAIQRLKPTLEQQNWDEVQSQMGSLVQSHPLIDAAKLSNSHGRRAVSAISPKSGIFSSDNYVSSELPKLAVIATPDGSFVMSYILEVPATSGQTLATLEISLNKRTFQHLIERLKVSPEQLLALVGPNGQWIYSQPQSTDVTGTWLSKPDTLRMIAFGTSERGDWHLESLADGQFGIETYPIRLTTDDQSKTAPLHLITANSLNALLSKWHSENFQMVLLYLVLSGIAVVLTRFEANKQAERIREKLLADRLILENQQRLKLATSSAGIGVWEYNFDTNKVKLNSTMRQHYGFEADIKEIDLQLWLGLIKPDDRQQFVSLFKMRGFNSESINCRFQSHTNHSAALKHMQVSARYYPATEEYPARVVGVNSDITRQVESEAALREAKSKFKIAFESAAVGMMVFGLDDKIQSVNPATADILGFSEPVLTNMTIQALSHPQDVKHENQIKASLLDGKTASAQLEKRLIHKRGHVIWVQMSLSIVRDEHEKPLFFLCQVQDITKRKRSEAALIEREHFLRTLSECLPGLVSYWGRDFRCHFANRNYESWTGLKLEKLKGIHLRELHGDEVFNNDLPKLHAVLGGQSIQFERRLHKPNGEQADVLVHLIPDVIQGKVEGFFKLSTDISTLKMQQRELVKVNTELELRTEQAEKANMTKSTFLANMSHEIRTPMNAIMGLLQLVNETQLDAKQKNYLNKIGSAAEVLLNVLNDVLDVSRIEANRLELNPARFGLHSLLEKTMDLFSYSAREKGIEISFLKAPNCPTSIVADRLRLAQILNNLLSNALKFTEKGSIRVGIREVEAGKFIEFSVADSGMGMTQEQADSLFSPFSQLDNSSSRKFGGAGLGLSICKSLSELMGGSINVVSIPGKGSTFSFRIENIEPRYNEIEEPLPGDDEPTQPTIRRTRFTNENASPDEIIEVKDSELANSPLGQLRVLVVDDHKLNRMVAGEMIRNAGAHVSMAADGKQAVEMVLAESFDVVLMDLQMPEMDGFEATAAIKKAMQDKAPPIVAITASATEKDRQAVLDAGMIEHLVKPFKKEDLLRIIAEKGLAPGMRFEATGKSQPATQLS